MADTKELLKKISALRQRLDQAQPLVPVSADRERLAQQVEQKVRDGSRQLDLIDGLLRQMPETAQLPGQGTVLPTHLTARAVRLLEQGRDLLQQTRTLSEDPCLQKEEDGPLAGLHQEVVGMLESVLRSVQAFPSAPSAQYRLCQGLESLVGIIAEKLAILQVGLTHRRKERSRIESLACLLEDAVRGRAISHGMFQPLAEAILDEARRGSPLRFLAWNASEPAHFVAAHSLTAAQVLARILVHDQEWKARDQDAIITVLIHDVGMLELPPDLLAAPRSLKDSERRQLEHHPERGAEIASILWPGGGWMVEAIADHHERLDGTGYPHGKKDLKISSFAKVLSVCDVYAALACARPHRAAFDTRTALTDALVLAEQGGLDRFMAERLLLLSFYPAGSVVELSDGSAGVVVGHHTDPRGLAQPHKPVVAILVDGEGKPLPIPWTVNLLQEDRTILRTLPLERRRQLLVHHFPVLV